MLITLDSIEKSVEMRLYLGRVIINKLKKTNA